MHIHSADLYKSLLSYVNELRRSPVLCTVKFNTVSNSGTWYINFCNAPDRRFTGHESYPHQVSDTGVAIYVYNNVLAMYDHR